MIMDDFTDLLLIAVPGGVLVGIIAIVFFLVR